LWLNCGILTAGGLIVNTITISIPEQVLDIAATNVERDIKTYLAVKYYKEGLISIGKAAKLAEMPKIDFELFLARNDMPISLLDYSDVQADLRRMKTKEVLIA
jgi:predicted HTH domain antitoxin